MIYTARHATTDDYIYAGDDLEALAQLVTRHFKRVPVVITDAAGNVCKRYNLNAQNQGRPRRYEFDRTQINCQVHPDDKSALRSMAKLLNDTRQHAPDYQVMALATHPADATAIRQYADQLAMLRGNTSPDERSK